MTFTRSTIMHFTDLEEGAVSLAARVEGGRVTRTLGLGGDELAVLVRAEDWPLPNGPTQGGGIDFKRPCTLEFGRTFAGGSPAPETVVLEHYYIRQIDAEMVTADAWDDADEAPKSAKMVRIRFVTLPGYLRGDGRGAMLRERTLNPVLSSGEVDEDHADYKPNSELVDMCLAALGLAYEFSPVSLDETPPPGPLDWGNANALHELESVLDRCGHAAGLPNQGDQLRLIELPKRADTIVLDPEIEAALASDFITAKAPALRSDTVVVHSGATKTTVLTYRGLSDLEWVWFDENGFAWRNAAQTVSSGAGGLLPNDIAAFRAGPSPTDDEARAQYGRLFRALRLTGGDAGLRLIKAWEPVTFLDGTKLGSNAAFVRGRVSAMVGPEQFAGVPLDITSPFANLGGCEVHAEAGVFLLPPEFVYARPAADFTGSAAGTYGRGDMDALPGDGMTVYFAHEARFDESYGGFRVNYFVAAWKVTWSGTELVYTELTGDDLIAAIDDPTTVKVAAPWLKRLVRFDPGDLVPTDLNLTALKAQALGVAKRRASLALAESGVAVCAGWLDKAPGCCGGACGSVTWDLENVTTSFVLNDHETPDGELDQRAAEANRSFAAGVNRFAMPGSVVDLRDVRSAVVAGMNVAGGGASGGGGGSTSAEGASVSRGFEAGSVPARGGMADGVASGGQGYSGTLLARITGSTSLPGNRWAYTWTQVRAITSGSAAGTAVSVNNPMTSATHGLAYNLAESGNDGSGVEGNGFNIGNLPEGWGVQPIPSGAVVLIAFCARDVTVGSGGGRAAFFHCVNAVDGVCPSSGAGGGGGSLLRPVSDGDTDAIDAVFVSRDSEVFLDRDRSAFVSSLAAGVSQSDLNAVTSLFTSRTGEFFSGRAGNLFSGRHHGAVSAASHQLVNRVFVARNGRPFVSRTRNLLNGR